MLQQAAPRAEAPPARAPRAQGSARLSVRLRGERSVLGDFRMSGALRVLFPRQSRRMEAVLINTAGGLTGGDRIELQARVEAGAHLALTTQAAERVYRSAAGTAGVTTALSADDGAHLSWLPQELIVYDGGALRRQLRIALAPTATLLMVEPVVFGRAAMGERVRSGAVSDRIAITRAGRPLYVDGLHLTGDIDAALRGRAAANGAGAMASVVYAAPDAQAHLAAVRTLLPLTGGASVLQDGLLVIRLVARDAFDLRRHLVPILDRLSRDTLPAAWRL